MWRACLVLAGVMVLGGCASESQQNPAQANAAQSQPYAAGTGVSSSSFDRHPRFYTGEQNAAPATQPASGQ